MPRADVLPVAVLLATYRPNKEWLAELLDSLDAQTYPALHLYVRDDASPDGSGEDLDALLSAHLSRVPFTLLRNAENLGSNRTFEQLVRDAEEPLIAFCDQDDVWLPNKIENTVNLLRNSPLRPTLVCTDLSVINGDGKEIAPRMEKHRKRHVFRRGEGLAGELIYRNFVVGCTVVMERERARSYLPFPDGVVHDHYLAFRAACDGALDYLPDPQIRYRVYGGNQTGVMTGVTDKESYKRERIDVFETRVRAFSAHADFPELSDALAWCRARHENYYRCKGSFRALWHLRKRNRATSLFELFALRFPTPLWRVAVKAVQKRLL